MSPRKTRARLEKRGNEPLKTKGRGTRTTPGPHQEGGGKVLRREKI